MSYGMNFGTTDAINSPTYTTTQNRLQIDLNNPAPLFNLVTIPAGTGFSVNLAAVQSDTEQLLLVNHNLGYVPQVYVTMILTPINPTNNPSTYAGAYGIGVGLIAAGGAAVDSIGYALTTTTMTINHTVTSNGQGSGSYTSYAPDYNLTIKYLICNNVGIQTIIFN
jgi:hypothetical protein